MKMILEFIHRIVFFFKAQIELQVFKEINR